MSVPFYADAEKLSLKGPNFNRVWLYISGFIWMIVTGYLFSYLDSHDSRILRSLGVITIVGLPICIILKVKRDVWKQGNQKLKKLYREHTADQSVTLFFILIIWQLVGRWIFEDVNFEKLGLILLPYILLITIYLGVQKDIKKLVGHSDSD